MTRPLTRRLTSRRPAGGADGRLSGNRDFLIMSSGNGLSQVGTAAAGMVLPLTVLHSTGSTLWVGAVEAVWAASLGLACVPAGPIVDRFDRGTVLMICDAGRALASAALALASLDGRPPVWILLSVGVVLGFLGAPSNAAVLASLRQLVPGSRLSAAVSVTLGRIQAANLIGPIAGGFLFSVSPSAPFWFNACSFVISGVCVFAVRRSLRATPATGSRFLNDLTAGFRFVWRERLQRTCLLTTMALGLILQGILLLVILVNAQRGASGPSVGFIVSAATAGALVGTVLAPIAGDRFPPVRLVMGATAVTGCLVVVMTTARDRIALAALLALAMVVMSIAGSVLTTTRLLRTPDDFQGRVNSVFHLTQFAAALGPTMAGLMLDRLSGGTGLLIFAGLLWALTLLLARLKVPAPEAAAGSPDPDAPAPGGRA
ncbi:MFS transporter [Nonomuraea mangrovi]|uniref:MFS transporter n=1 Tax=Nonomuraea mangrovi TaxID=2316207 RepID=A0ABW4SMN8_9ACTN